MDRIIRVKIKYQQEVFVTKTANKQHHILRYSVLFFLFLVRLNEMTAMKSTFFYVRHYVHLWILFTIGTDNNISLVTFGRCINVKRK